MLNKLPENYLNSMKKLLGQDYQSYLDSFQEARSYGLRINTAKISVEDFLKISPFKLTPIPWTSNGFYYDEDTRPSKHPYYYAGLYYLQEPSAMLPAQILPIEKGDIVLDACSAPGGKATELVVKLDGSGLLYSNDLSSSRQQATIKNLELFGKGNIVVGANNILDLKDVYPEYFDKILLDAPCSGEGMFRKEPSLIDSWLEKGNEYYSKLQKELIIATARMLKPGGMMVYSTCTFSIHEDEEIIKYLLDTIPDFEVLPIKQCEGFSKGIVIDNNTQLENCVRLYPFKIQGEGHFVALLHKKGTSAKNVTRNSISGDFKEASDFFKHLNKPLTDGHFKVINDHLLFIPSCYQQHNARILRSGLLYGEFKNKRFTPSQALAMSLNANDFDQVVNLAIDDERVIRYLKGETIDIDKKLKDWILICVDGYPLGWGKANNGLLNNKYPANWRYL